MDRAALATARPKAAGDSLRDGRVILLFNVAILAWTSEQSQSQAQWANHSLEVQNKLSDVLLLLRTAESEQRAYILVSGKTAYRTSYLEAAKEIPVKLAEVRAMTSDNPSQSEKLRELEPLIQAKLEDLALKVRLLEAGDTATAVSLFQQEKGRELMAAIKARVTQLCAAEQQLLSTRSDRATRASRQLLFVGMADSLVIFLLGWLTIFFSLRSIQSLEAVKIALEAKVEERVAELREAYDEMQSFAYIVGHDLRAPLVNIMGFTSEVETLWNATSDPPQPAQSSSGELKESGAGGVRRSDWIHQSGDVEDGAVDWRRFGDFANGQAGAETRANRHDGADEQHRNDACS